MCWFAFGRYIHVTSQACSVLLDLDGTLIDSRPGILASCLAALRALGHQPDATPDIKRLIGPPLEDIMQVLLQPYGDDRMGEAVAVAPTGIEPGSDSKSRRAGRPRGSPRMTGSRRSDDRPEMEGG
jgi:beta-phosphoglucomutase-like phosphatase (HAD superfamily)